MFLRSLTSSLRRHFSTGISVRPVYLDAQATTPVDPRVLDAMLPLMTESFGNAHSRTHAFGWEAGECSSCAKFDFVVQVFAHLLWFRRVKHYTESLVEEAREHIADLIGAESGEIVFTSGATESNNLAIKGVARFAAKGQKKKNHIITTLTVSANSHADIAFFISRCRNCRSTSAFSTRAVAWRTTASKSRICPVSTTRGARTVCSLLLIYGVYLAFCVCVLHS
jgi:hypothetical protein